MWSTFVTLDQEQFWTSTDGTSKALVSSAQTYFELYQGSYYLVTKNFSKSVMVYHNKDIS